MCCEEVIPKQPDIQFSIKEKIYHITYTTFR